VLATKLQPVRTPFLPLAVPEAEITPTHSVRGTLILSSLKTLEERDLFDAYFQHLAPRSHNEIRALIAGAWYPIDLAIDHYRACEALGVTRAEQLALGKGVGQKQDRTLFQSILSLAKQAGATPWLPLSMLGKIQDRVFLGGALAVYKLSPKDAEIDLHGFSVLQFKYVQNAYCGMFQNTCESFCRKAYMKVHTFTPAKTTFSLSWA